VQADWLAVQRGGEPRVASSEWGNGPGVAPPPTSGPGTQPIVHHAWRLAYERGRGAFPATVRTYRYSIASFLAFLKRRSGLITAPVVADYRVWLLSHDLSRETVNLRLTAVRRFDAYVVYVGLMLTNPAREVPGERKRDRAILGLLPYTGMRQIEVHRLHLEDTENRDGRVILWLQGKRHDGKDDFVVLPEQAIARHKSINTTMVYYHEVNRLLAPAEDYSRFA